MMPIRANIVGPPSSTTSINASMAGLPLRRVVIFLRQRGNVFAGIA